jgi:hypothetical protein
VLNFQTVSQHLDFRDTWVNGTRGESWWFDHAKAQCVCIWCDFLEIISGKEAVSFCLTADQTGTNILKETLLPDVISSILADKKPGRRLRAWMNPLLGDSAPLGYALKTAELGQGLCGS